MALLTYANALKLALHEEMDRDPDVFILGEEVGQYLGTLQVTKGFLEQYGPKRVIDTPISEVGIVGLAIGSAMAGLRPVAEMMRMDFALPAYDQIAQHAAKIRYMFGGQFKVPMVIRGPSGVGNQLSAQHSQSIEALFAHIPGLKVVVPGTATDAKGLLKTAIRDDNPVIFLESLRMYFDKRYIEDVPDDPEFTVPFGQANILHEGKDITLIGYSTMTQMNLRAAELLDKENISAEVVDLRTLLPLDMATPLASIKKTHRAVVAQEQWGLYGCAAEISAQISERAFYDLDAPVQRVTGAFTPMPYSKALESLTYPNENDIVTAAKRALYGK